MEAAVDAESKTAAVSIAVDAAVSVDPHDPFVVLKNMCPVERDGLTKLEGVLKEAPFNAKSLLTMPIGGCTRSPVRFERAAFDLYRFIEKRRVPWGERFGATEFNMLAEQMRRSVEAMHAVDFIHCDVKPENFLVYFCQHGRRAYEEPVDLDPAAYVRCMRIRLADLGGATRSGRRILNVSHAFLPPGVVEQPVELIRARRRLDCWALGVSCVMLAAGSSPWRFATPRDANFRAAGRMVDGCFRINPTGLDWLPEHAAGPVREMLCN